MTMKPILPPTYLLICLVLMGGLWFLVPGPSVVPNPWSLTGMALVTVGCFLNVIGDAQFKRAKTAMNPFGRPTALVTAGVFNYSRNPMYLGMLLLVLGAAMLLGRATPFLGPVLLFVVLNSQFVAHEERTMAARFGEEYLRYRTRVRRWL